MLPPPEQELRESAKLWIAARESFMLGTGERPLDAFSQATDRLYAAFVAGLSIPQAHIIEEAFNQFRAVLAAEQDIQLGVLPSKRCKVMRVARA